MDIDDTIGALLTCFAKELQDQPQNKEKIVEDMKWKMLCVFAATNTPYDVATSLGELQIPLQLAAK